MAWTLAWWGQDKEALLSKSKAEKGLFSGSLWEGVSQEWRPIQRKGRSEVLLRAGWILSKSYRQTLIPRQWDSEINLVICHLRI